MEEAGKLVIKVTADTANFDKELERWQKQYQAKEIRLQSTEKQLEKESAKLDEIIRSNEKLTNEYNKQLQLREEIISQLKDISNYDSSMVYQTPKDVKIGMQPFAGQEVAFKNLNKDLQKNYFTLTRINNEYSPILEQQETQQALVDRLNASYLQQTASIEQLGDKIANKVNGELDKTTKSIKQTHIASNNTLGSIKKWGLAIIGVRSLYAGIRQVMNSVLSQNEGLKNQMDGIKQSFANAFLPVVKKIISALQTLMVYINYIWSALFKKPLFKDAEVSSGKTSKNLASGAKSAKEINKQLASFDEANVLSSNQNTGGGGGGTGANDNTYKFSLPDNIPIPKWLEYIHDFIEKHPNISKFIFGLAAFTMFGGWKLAGGILGAISSILGVGSAGTGLLGIASTLNLLTAAVWLITLDIAGVAMVIDGIHKTQDALNHKNETTDNTILKDKELVEVSKNIIKTEDESSDKRKQAVKGIDKVTKSTRDLLENDKLGWKTKLDYQDALVDEALSMDDLFRSTDLTEEEQYQYYKMLRDQFAPMVDDTTGKLLYGKDTSDQLRDSFKKLDKKFQTKYNIEMSETGSNKLINAANRIKDSFGSIQQKWETVTSKMAASLGITVKKNALGGIVNMPGRGVPLNIVGEAGREGIIPMDNQQQMQVLGQAIAKYITINANIVNEMNGRIISRELQKINNESSFAFND